MSTCPKIQGMFKQTYSDMGEETKDQGRLEDLWLDSDQVWLLFLAPSHFAACFYFNQMLLLLLLLLHACCSNIWLLSESYPFFLSPFGNTPMPRDIWDIEIESWLVTLIFFPSLYSWHTLPYKKRIDKQAPCMTPTNDCRYFSLCTYVYSTHTNGQDG